MKSEKCLFHFSLELKSATWHFSLFTWPEKCNVALFTFHCFPWVPLGNTSAGHIPPGNAAGHRYHPGRPRKNIQKSIQDHSRNRTQKQSNIEAISRAILEPVKSKSDGKRRCGSDSEINLSKQGNGKRVSFSCFPLASYCFWWPQSISHKIP